MNITSKEQKDQARIELDELASQAVGEVIVSSPYGDVYNLRSILSRYTALGKLIHDHKDVLTLTCSDESDQLKFDKWMSKYAN